MHYSFTAVSVLLRALPLCILCCACGGGGARGGAAAAAPQPAAAGDLQRWEADLMNYGKRYCNSNDIKAQQTWEGGVWYYDGARIYYETSDFTGDAQWDACAEYVLETYRPYVVDNQGRIPGWRVFPHGLFQNYKRTGNSSSREAVLLLAHNSAYAAQAGGADPELSRETAYLIHAYLFAEQLGANDVEPLRKRAVDNALGHLRAWTADESTEYVKPFMVALTIEALIHLRDDYPDERVLPAVSHAANWLWRNAWRQENGAFPYIVCRHDARNAECQTNRNEMAPDLNLLVAPAYAWLYFQTGDEEQARRADAVFAGGVRGADLNSGKRFSQNYRWSFNYLRWRYGIESAAGIS